MSIHGVTDGSSHPPWDPCWHMQAVRERSLVAVGSVSTRFLHDCMTCRLQLC